MDRRHSRSGAGGREIGSNFRLQVQGHDHASHPGDEDVVEKQPHWGEPDAHGQAALILAESILHTLIETGILTKSQALLTVQTACEVKADMAADIGESEGRMKRSLTLLAAISRSLETDLAQ